MHNRNTKIVCTLGPSSDSVKEITNLINAGMNVARLNFSHGTYEHHAKLINNIHKAEKITGKRIGILQDLQGPKIRIGEMPKEGIDLKNNQIVTFTVNSTIGHIEKDNDVVIPINYKNIIKDVKKNDIILINDGLIEVKILKVGKVHLRCKVKDGGTVKKGNGINLPTSSISQKTITAKDKRDLEFGLNHNVDFVALSFVKSAQDLHELRKMIQRKKKNTAIIAKIERHEAIKSLNKIIQVSDGVMVARGDLGADMRAEQVPIVQKRMIALANKYGKPVITATQVLYSMVKNPRPTRAEISDAANAVFDHTDAIMLSNETAVGKYPVQATATLTKVSAAVEKEMQKYKELQTEIISPRKCLTPINATCLNACELASDTKADFLIIYTNDGYTARQVARHRHYIPIITITNNEKTARELTLVWGMNDIYVHPIQQNSTNKVAEIIKFLKNKKKIKKGNKVVVVCNASKKEKLITTLQI